MGVDNIQGKGSHNPNEIPNAKIRQKHLLIEYYKISFPLYGEQTHKTIA